MKTDGIKVGHEISLIPIHDRIIGVFFEAVPDSNLVRVAKGIMGHTELRGDVAVGKCGAFVIVVEFCEADIARGR